MCACGHPFASNQNPLLYCLNELKYHSRRRLLQQYFSYNLLITSMWLNWKYVCSSHLSKWWIFFIREVCIILFYSMYSMFDQFFFLKIMQILMRALSSPPFANYRVWWSLADSKYAGTALFVKKCCQPKKVFFNLDKIGISSSISCI